MDRGYCTKSCENKSEQASNWSIEREKERQLNDIMCALVWFEIRYI